MAFTSSVFDGLNAGKTGVTVHSELREGDPSSLLIVVEGYIETGNAPLFRTEMTGMIPYCPEFRTIVIDMGQITYLSSLGIGAFTAILTQAKAAGKKLLLANIPKKIEDLLRMLGFWDMFDKTERSDRAVAPDAGAEPAFPVAVRCASCGKSLKVGRQGAFRCPSCRSFFAVDESGKVV